MTRSSNRIGAWLAVLALVVLGVVFRDRLPFPGPGSGRDFNPCVEPLHWRVGRVDARFDLSREELRETVEAAAAVWESTTGRRFFRHDPVDGWPIELVYDGRQQAADGERSRQQRLAALNAEITRLELAHERNQRDYERARRAYERRAATLAETVDSYNATVERWNRQGGAPASVRDRLRGRAAEIERERAEVDRLRTSLEERRERVNAEARELERTIDEYNALVRESGRTTATEVESGVFEETVLTRGGRTVRTERRLRVYQFGGREELLLILTHELGHALGLEHVPEPDAVMHARHESGGAGRTLRLHEADLTALVQRCGVDAWDAMPRSSTGPDPTTADPD